LEQSEITGLPVTDGSIGVLHGTEMSGGHVMFGGELSATTRVTWHVLSTLPGNVMVTRTITDPGFEVVTTTGQLVTFEHELLPTIDAPAVLLCSDQAALNVVVGKLGAVATKFASVPQSAVLGPWMKQYENCAPATGAKRTLSATMAPAA
jgi:hypothetical protein